MEEWKKVASQLDKDHAKGKASVQCMDRHFGTFSITDTFVLFLILRIQEGQSGHQEEVIRHNQTAEEG